MQKRIERVINLLVFLLTADRPVTADEIRTTVAGYVQDSDEAFKRTFERDKELLRRLGVPIELRPTDAWEVEFGYVVPGDEYALPDPGLTDEERAALLLAARAVRFDGDQAGADAILKLGGSPIADGGEPLSADLGVSVDLLGDAFAAVTERRRVAFRYRDRQRRVHPYGLVHRRGHWYLVGAEAGDGLVKAFRLDRMERLCLGDEPGAFRRPPDFDVAGAVPEAPWDLGEETVTARVRFDPDVAWLALRELGDRGRVLHEDDDGVVVETTVAAPEPFLGWLIAFEDRFELLAPPPLRRQLGELVGETA